MARYFWSAVFIWRVPVAAQNREKINVDTIDGGFCNVNEHYRVLQDHYYL